MPDHVQLKHDSCHRFVDYVEQTSMGRGTTALPVIYEKGRAEPWGVLGRGSDGQWTYFYGATLIEAYQAAVREMYS